MSSSSLQIALKEAWGQRSSSDLSNNNFQSYIKFQESYKGMMAGMSPSAAEVEARESAVKQGVPVITMTAGKPDASLLPYNDLLEFLKVAWERSRPAPLEYGSSQVLRDEIAKYLTRTRGHPVRGDEIFISSGNSSGLKTVFRGYLDPGDIAIVESPLWTITANYIHQQGATAVPVGMDAEGISVVEVEQQILAAKRAGKRMKLIYVQPVNHNPTGTTISQPRAEALLRLAAAHAVAIVSDEPYEMYCYDEQPCFLSSLSGGWGVLTVHTFSKTLGTGLRLGYVHSNPEWLVPLQALWGMDDSILLEYAVGELMASGRYEQIIASAKAVYTEKMRVFCEALVAHAGHHLAVRPRAQGGFFVWIELASLPAEAVHLQMLARGLEARVGKNMHAPNHQETSSRGAPKFCHIGFSFIGPSLDELVEAAKRVAAACDAVQAQGLEHSSMAPTASL